MYWIYVRQAGKALPVANISVKTGLSLLYQIRSH